LPRKLVEAVQIEMQKSERRHRRIERLRRAFHSGVIGWPARVVYSTLARRR
jgi:hypothetical protein